MKDRIKKLIFLLALGSMTLAACEKEQMTNEAEPEPYYPPFIAEKVDASLSHPKLSALKDSVLTWRAAGGFKNVVVDSVEVDSTQYLDAVFNATDNIHFNSILSSVPEIGKSANGVVAEKANIWFSPTTTHASNTKEFDGISQNPEINMVYVEQGNVVNMDTLNFISAANATTTYGVDFTAPTPTTTTLDIAGKTFSKAEWNELYANTSNGTVKYNIVAPTELGSIAEGDTISYGAARYTFSFAANTPYFNAANAFVTTGLNPAYLPAVVNAFLTSLPENLPGVVFLFGDGSHIPESYYNTK